MSSSVKMRVLADHGRVVRMIVMSIVVAMSVFVLGRLVTGSVTAS